MTLTAKQMTTNGVIKETVYDGGDAQIRRHLYQDVETQVDHIAALRADHPKAYTDTKTKRRLAVLPPVIVQQLMVDHGIDVTRMANMPPDKKRKLWALLNGDLAAFKCVDGVLRV